jgi:hypothetical protein
MTMSPDVIELVVTVGVPVVDPVPAAPVMYETVFPAPGTTSCNAQFFAVTFGEKATVIVSPVVSAPPFCGVVQKQSSTPADAAPLSKIGLTRRVHVLPLVSVTPVIAELAPPEPALSQAMTATAIEPAARLPLGANARDADAVLLPPCPRLVPVSAIF